MNDIEPMNHNQLEDAGSLPVGLKQQLLKRRKIRRLKLTGGALITAIAIVGLSAMLLPTTPSEESLQALPSNSNALTINDPLFEHLDRSNTPKMDTDRWRADRFLHDDWTLEM